jgi:hypothetical protein
MRPRIRDDARLAQATPNSAVAPDANRCFTVFREPTSSRAVRAGEPRAVGRQKIMRSGALLFLVLASCTGDEQVSPARPPAQPNRAAEIARHDPTAEFLKENPPPRAGDLGCFELHTADQVSSDWRPLPRRIQLTALPRQGSAAAVQTSYRVESRDALQPNDERWLWTPLAGDRATVVMGDGFVGWELKLSSSATGFAGVATWYTDMAPFRNQPIINISLVRTGCE